MVESIASISGLMRFVHQNAEAVIEDRMLVLADPVAGISAPISARLLARFASAYSSHARSLLIHAEEARIIRDLLSKKSAGERTGPRLARTS